MKHDTSKSFSDILNKVPNLNECDALDIFAREGNWISNELLGKVKSLEAWEIEPKFIEKLKLNLPNSKVYCRDSIKFINTTKYNKFNLLIIDNGLNCYGKNNEFCEHFDFIYNIGNVVKDKCFVIFNVLLTPSNIENFPEWGERRNNFYKVKNTNQLSTSFISKFYQELFNSIGFKTINYHSICREYNKDKEHLFFVGIELEKN